jgi:basic membrane protein A
MDPTINVAEKFPDVKFEHATGYKRADNVSTYSARFYEGRAVIGHDRRPHDRDQQDRLHRLLPDPRGDPRHQLGLYPRQEGQPGCRVQVVWAYTWFDPAKEADAAKALIEQGAT